MIHLLLVSSGVLFALWLIALGGGATTSATWTLFALAAFLFSIWLVATSMGRRLVT